MNYGVAGFTVIGLVVYMLYAIKKMVTNIKINNEEACCKKS